MTFVTKLDMEAVRREMQEYLQQLRRSGHALPVLKDGRIVYLPGETPQQFPGAAEPMHEMGFAEPPAKRIEPPKE
jgi:hypothetical protein